MKIYFKFFLLPILVLTSSCSNKQEFTFISGENEHLTYYDDSYFLLDNGTYHQEISLASYASAMATINSDEDYSKNSDNLISLWKKEGFTDFYISPLYTKKPTTESIGYAIGRKLVEINDDKFNLITIAVRGGGYGPEWVNSFTVGASGNAKGFEIASNIVLNGINDYLDDNNISGKTKFWLSGYSRGGCVSNLVAGELCRKANKGRFYQDIKTTINDIYAYCFEAPSGVLYDEDTSKLNLYRGIHNLYNFNDLSSSLIPYQWGFTHYGQDYYYPDRLTDIYFNVSERHKLVANYHFTRGAHDFPEYNIDNWRFYDPGKELADLYYLPRENIYPSMGRAITYAINAFCQFVSSRDMYVQLIENGIKEFILAFLGLNPKIGEKTINAEMLMNVINNYQFTRALLTELINGDTAAFSSDMKFFLFDLFGVNENNIDAINELYGANFMLFNIIAHSLTNRKDLTLQIFNRDNIASLSTAYSPELNYSFTKSCDTRFYGKNACKLNDGSYYLLHVENTKSFSIEEKHLTKTVFKYENEKMTSDYLSCERISDNDLNIFLPKNGGYIYKGEADNITLYDVDAQGRETVLQENMPTNGTI